MRVGFSLPFSHADKTSMSAAEIGQIAKQMEDAGFSGVWLGDVVGRGLYSSGQPYPPRPDPLMWLLVAALATTKLEIGTAVLQVPVRARIDLAQRIMTLHAISGGRYIAGVGTGSSLPDFEAAGIEYDKRFSILRENLDVMRALWRGEQVGSANLRPWTNTIGGPPVVIGAWVSKLWIKRAARDYDGWLVSGGHVGGHTNTIAILREAMKIFRDEGGKRAIIAAGNPRFDKEAGPLTDASSFSLRCTPAEARERLEQIAALGFDDVILRNDNVTPDDIDMVSEALGLRHTAASQIT